ncbi:MAG: NADH-quinone oxidoreductase subunit C [Candidatus Aenigmarchaeota archaeon]|nr:NADH-quinone oxidoreductase subunit C [Candidatus Aenigmarchaeota archaeon]
MNAEDILKGLMEEVIVKGNEIWTKFDSSKLKNIMKKLHDSGIQRVITISGVDVAEGIDVIYHMEHEGTVINLRTTLPKEKPEIDTITGIFPGADLFERELMEMLGVTVNGHPNPKRLFLAEQSPKNPLRRS